MELIQKSGFPKSDFKAVETQEFLPTAWELKINNFRIS